MSNYLNKQNFTYFLILFTIFILDFFDFKFLIGKLHGNFQNFMSAFVEFGSLCFGVLLTFFGIVIQSSSDTVRRMKRKTKMFNRFIRYNRSIIMFSLALTIYAYIFGNLDFWKETSYCVPPIVISIFCGAFAYFIYGLCYLLIIFFLLLQQHEDKL